MKKIIDYTAKHPVAITALVFFIFYFLPFKPKPFGDGEYHEGTIQLIEYVFNGFNGSIRIDKGLFTLFYYFIPYLIGYFFQDNSLYYLFGIIFNSIVTCVAIYYLFQSFEFLKFNVNSKFYAILILCLFPIHAYYAMGILAESAAFFSISIFIYALIRISLNKSGLKYYLILSFSLVMLVGTRPNLLPFLILMLFYFLLKKIELKPKIYFVISIILFMFSLLLFENKFNADKEDFKSKVFRNQILWSRFELRDEPFNWLPQHGEDSFASMDYLNNLKKRKQLDSICESNNYDKTKYYMNWVKEDIYQNPILTFRQYFLKFFQSQSFIISPLMKSNKSNYIKYGVHVYINAINYILIFISLWGIFLLYKNNQYDLFLPFLFLWSWSLIYIFIFHSEQRYMFPIRPVLLFLFAYSINNYQIKIKEIKNA